VASSQDRITPTVDLRQAALSSELELDVPSSSVRPLVPPFAVPWLTVTLDELRGLPLDHRAMFLVSLIDGTCSIEMLADISCRKLDEVTALFTMLVQAGAVELRDPR
jgi:hypothetical protein